MLNLPANFKVSHVNQCSSKPNRGFPNAEKDLRKFSKIGTNKYVLMQVKYASMQVCKYACLLVCKYASMKVCKCTSACAQAWKFAKISLDICF